MEFHSTNILPIVTIKGKEDSFIFSFSYNAEIIETIKKLNNRHYDALTRTWIVPKNQNDKENIINTFWEKLQKLYLCKTKFVRISLV